MSLAPFAPILSAAAFLSAPVLRDIEEQARQRLVSQLRKAQTANARQESFYEGSRRAADLGISIPPALRDKVEAVAGWPEIVVDVMDERMDWRGWDDEVDLGLAQVASENHLPVEVGQATLDALIFGLSYLTVGTGAEGEPDVLVKAESPNAMTATWDPRLRRVTEALRESRDLHDRVVGWTLYLPDVTIRTERRGGRLVVVDRDEHGLGRVPVSVLLNRPRGSRSGGRSEITRAVRYHTENAMRTLVGMEVAREFYAAPQRWLMGADESMFVDETGKPVSQWQAIIGRILMAPRDEEGNVPTPGQFNPASPAPFTELLKTSGQFVSANTGVSLSHLGFGSDNPSSEGALARADQRIDKRTIRRQRNYNMGLDDLGENVCLWRDGELPPRGAVRSVWVPVGMTSPGAQADRATKAIASGVLDPAWDITARQFGFDDREVKEIQRERRRSGGSAALRAVSARAAEAPAPAVPPLALPDA